MSKNTSVKPQQSRATSSQASTRIVRKLMSSPSSLYARLSGPATTARERTQAELVDFRNSLGRALLGR